ncbi:hypothetical protein [Streptomyces sp. NPDC055036]
MSTTDPRALLRATAAVPALAAVEDPVTSEQDAEDTARHLLGHDQEHARG